MEGAQKREELLEQQAAANATLAGVRARLKAERQKQKDAAKRRRAQWQLTAQQQRVALILHCKAGYEASAAAAWLSGVARQRHWEARPEEEVKRLVDDLFMQVDEQELADLQDESNPSDQQAMHIAVRFWEEESLAVWVEDTNQRKGVAPTTDIVLERLERQRLEVPESSRPASRGVAAEVKARMWAMRWRRGHNLRHGAIPTREPLTIDEMQDKARHCFKIRAHRRRFEGPLLGASGAIPYRPSGFLAGGPLGSFLEPKLVNFWCPFWEPIWFQFWVPRWSSCIALLYG